MGKDLRVIPLPNVEDHGGGLFKQNKNEKNYE